MATHSSSTCTLPEGLRYYLLRSNAMGGGMMVPLVPVDQLPFQLQGIPRQLTHRQISDGGWKLCSETNEAPLALSIQAPTATSFPSHLSPTAKPRYLAPDHHVRIEPQTIPVDYYRPTRSSHQLPLVANSAQSPTLVNSPEQPRPKPTTTLDRRSSLTDTFASIYQKDAQRFGYRVPRPSGIEPDPSKKEYCTHWIKTGECDWTAIGCKFKHEMPSIEKLRELGFVRGIPRWWQEKSAMVARAPTWMQRRLAGNEDAEQAGEVPEPRVFPDPSTFRVRCAEGHDSVGAEVQQPRSILRRESSHKQTTAGRLTPPSAPVQDRVRRVSEMPDLLIDLEDTPAPPPRPQPSHTSAASAGSRETWFSSSRTSASPPPPSLPSFDRNTSLLIDYELPSQTATEKTMESKPSIRRHSQLSWASDTEDDTAISMSTNSNSNAKHSRLYQQRRRNPPRIGNNSNRRPATTSTTALTQTKPQSGLASSKHAPSANTAKDNTAKPIANRGRNSGNRKNAEKSGGEVGTPELQAKIEQLRREAHRDDRSRKGVGAAAAVAVDGR
ncbi:hypothetical protein G6011_03940 [Alternaria panax]|uniref:C3H1-type domain-containing protein n=1 Tax=Alternaria panax TaxID=48097 RepID=A0AAD4IFY5_9PLEO|nr:hypothetical protein G6011_03940 [Alternaria panax]